MFALSLVSSGSSIESFFIRIPITLSPNVEFDIGDGICFRCHGYSVELIKGWQQYYLHVHAFSSVVEASEWLSRFSAALLWMIVERRIGLGFERTPSDLGIVGNTGPVNPESEVAKIPGVMEMGFLDGICEGDRTAVVPAHRRLVGTHMGTGIRVVSSLGLREIANSLEGGLDKTRNTIANPRVHLAVDIYASSFFEASPAARFLTLMMVLESLCGSTSRPDALQCLVDKFVDETRSQQVTFKTSGNNDEITSFIGSLRQLKRRSIGQNIRSLLRSTLEGTPSEGQIEKFSSLYVIRSKLVHEGNKDESKIRHGLGILSEVVPVVLIRLLSGQVVLTN